MTYITYRVEGEYLISNLILDDDAGKFPEKTPAWDIHGDAPDGNICGKLCISKEFLLGRMYMI